MPPETETEPQKAKRSQTKKELAALGKLLEVLKPFDKTQCEKLIETANFMLKDS